jgi:ABC-type nitrate/sulfonate/bicarbonate transport system substrate-binding protein
MSSHVCCRRALLSSLGAIAALALCDVGAAFAAKIKMVFPGPVTTFSLPYLVAQKKGWLGDLEVEDVHVTGDANAMRVLLSGNADIGLIGTLNVLASIHAGAGIRAIHSWQPIGDYSLVLATGKGDKYANVFATAKLFVPIIVIALVGVVLTELVMWLERRMSRWRQLERERF